MYGAAEARSGALCRLAHAGHHGAPVRGVETMRHFNMADFPSGRRVRPLQAAGPAKPAGRRAPLVQWALDEAQSVARPLRWPGATAMPNLQRSSPTHLGTRHHEAVIRRPFHRGANALNSTGRSTGWSPSLLAGHAGALPVMAVLERACGGRHFMGACPRAVQHPAACGHTGDAVWVTLALLQPASDVLTQGASRRCRTGHGGQHVASGHRLTSSVTSPSSWRPVTRRRPGHSPQPVGGPGCTAATRRCHATTVPQSP